MNYQWDRLFDRVDEWNRSVDRWVDRIHEISNARHLQPSLSVVPSRPALDVYETDNSLVVLAELAGIAAEDITIQLQPGHLVIQGKRRGILPDTVRVLHQMEIWSGPFSVDVALPSGLDFETATSRYCAGLLEVTLPKSTTAIASAILCSSSFGREIDRDLRLYVFRNQPSHLRFTRRTANFADSGGGGLSVHDITRSGGAG